MAENKKGGSDFSLPSAGAIAAVLSLIGYLLIGPNAFVDERPNNQEGIVSNTGTVQDVDARLWQDPFDAIKKDKEKSASQTASLVLSKKNDSFTVKVKGNLGSENSDEHSREQPFKKSDFYWNGYKHNEGDPGTGTQKVKREITVIAAMVSAGPYSEMQEMRIRRRYALVSALSTLRFKPRDPEHIGYLKPDIKSVPDIPEAIPFEWYDPQSHDRADDCAKQNAFQCSEVLVLWVDDTRFSQNPIEKIKEIFNQVTPPQTDDHPKIDFHYAVIGPNDSGQLKALVKKVTDDNGCLDKNIKFYSAAATVEAAWILEGLPKKSGRPCKADAVTPPSNKNEKNIDELNLVNTLNDRSVSLVRTISDDKLVAKKLINELEQRQVNPDKDHIVLLSEWDTFYGRALPLTFAAAYQGEPYKWHGLDAYEENKWQGLHPKNAATYNDISECESFSNSATGRVHCFSYERGIDGKLPGSTVKEETKSGSQPTSNEKKFFDTYDRPDGLSQKDYLRRLVDQIRELDHKLIDQNGCSDPSERCGVSAIGVLGYDVYDKLAILQALRPYFPGKIFFTTGLDALYSSPKELISTHNLIVASSFGLSLRSEIQKNIPPFRDSYQTSFFLATLLAIMDNKTESGNITLASQLKGWLAEPRIFEIGRKGPVDLSKKINYPLCNTYLFHCDDIHPPSVWTRHRSNEVFLIYALLVLGVTLLYRVSWTFREAVKNIREPIWETIKNPLSKAGAILFAVLVVALTLVWIIRAYAPPNEEPWLWADGISIWPAEVLRILAFILSVLFLISIRKDLYKSNEGLEKKYKISLDKKLQCVPLYTGLKSIHNWVAPELDNGKINAKKLWNEYREKNVFHARVMRSSLNLSIFVAFSYTAIMLSGGLPVPARGDLAFYSDKLIVFFSGISVLLLTMIVVDASRLGHRFIQHLSGNGEPSNWSIAASYSGDWGLDEDYIAYWIDVRFVADFTEIIGKFIWYPIISLLLMVAARSSVFDNSTLSSGLVISISILLLYLFSCAFWLQNGASGMREKALRELGKKLRLLRWKNIPDEKKAQVEKEIAQVESMIEEIENIKRGAFTPFMQQPPVRAVLAILGGGSGLPLLERFF